MEKNLVLIALFAALIAALGLIPQITLAFGVPITAQSLGVMLCGTVLGAKRGALAVGLFVLLVALGLPLLSGGRGGLGVFQSPTVGFVIGFPIAAFVAGWIVETWRGGALLWVAIVGALFGGVIALYIPGIIGLSVVLDKTIVEAAKLVAIFIPGDIVKAVIAGVITSALAQARPDSVLSRS